MSVNIVRTGNFTRTCSCLQLHVIGQNHNKWSWVMLKQHVLSCQSGTCLDSFLCMEVSGAIALAHEYFPCCVSTLNKSNSKDYIVYGHFTFAPR